MRLWRAIGEKFGSKLGSLHSTFNLTVITDEALMEEAFRYFDRFSCSLFSLGKREISLSSTPFGRDRKGVAIARVSDQGSGSKAVRGTVMGPLRMILADGREVKVSDLEGRESGTFEEALEGVSERVSQRMRKRGTKRGNCVGILVAWLSLAAILECRWRASKGKFCFFLKE